MKKQRVLQYCIISKKEYLVNDQNDIVKTLAPSTSKLFTPLTDNLGTSISTNFTLPAPNIDTEIIIKSHDIYLHIQQSIDE